MLVKSFVRPLACLALAGLAACGSAPKTETAAAPVSAPVPAPARVSIGLALGGGAAKGFAHIGVIKMLEANGLTPAFVAGTSAGSVVGALYASGMDAFALQEKAVGLDEASIRDLQFSSGGLVKGQKLEDYVNEQVQRRPLEKLAKPFVAVATRLEDGERTVFGRGNTGQAVRASSSVPGVFQPVGIGKYHYVDGGVVSPVPVDAARQLGADLVVAVDISSRPRGQSPSDMLGTLGQSIDIMGQKLGQAELARADIVIRPKVLDIGAADFTQRASAILEGEKAALAAMPQIRARVAQLQAERAQAAQAAQRKAAEAQYQACLENRSRLQKISGMVGLGDPCTPP
ncbi:patatin-like phospholipase family protein [Comamonas endophytica]|uniref:Patatin-like phospholipase family protein n=1 Tax=Comamonas endophytica TaxID=2949090 RepID=A0ABY6GA81_9BURK|nr:MULTISPECIES: patatin-like phospholipase family protein [unclassified Acidovorax]MCD2512202.1 patatin-like phospholipase family protein [Acidovorax sp. D4N7]UYG51971.1 patatin-like phospholipase family protein [Acidovorax sp. 5MLIR]